MIVTLLDRRPKCAMVSGAKCLIVSSHGEGRGNRGVDLAGFCLAKQLLFQPKNK